MEGKEIADDDDIVFPDDDSEIQNDLEELDNWKSDPNSQTPAGPDYYALNISTSQRSN